MIELRPAKYLLGRLAPMDNNDKIPQFNLGAGTYNSTVYLRGDGVWANPLAGAGFVPLTRELTINGVTYDLSANRTWTIDTTSATWGSITGTLSNQTDLQNALNAKQDDITLTTTGTSGAATFVGNTLNIPQYDGGLIGYVPYTGATANVNLGEYGLSAGWVQIDTTPTTYTPSVGKIGWNDQDGTLEFQLKGGNVTLQIGQEQVARVVNKTDPLIDLLESNYQVVKITGAQGNRLKIALAQANNDANSAETLGIVTENIPGNQEGFITTSGLVRNINTTGSLQGETWADGDMLYLSGTVAGKITKVKPSAPIHTVILGYVVRAHATQGQIYVKVDNGYELGELHDVNTNLSKATPVDADSVLLQDTADSNIWKKLSWLNTKATLKTYFDTLYQAVGSYVPSLRTITINSTTQDLSANRSWTIDKASVGLGNVDNTSDLNKQISTATQTALNAKQDNITLTTTGTSGAATLVGATLNIPQYQSVITNPVTGTGTTNYVSKFTGSGSIGNSIIFDNGFNVGIGTATPFRQLDVNGALRLQTGTIDFGNSTNNQIWVASNNINFKTNGSEKAIITSDGNLGIGTTNPTEKLDVVGNVKATLFNINGNGTLSQNGFWGTLNTKGTGSYSDWTLIDSVGNGIMWNPTGTLNMAFSGNVGIGTSNPTQKLSIVGGPSTYAQVNNGSNSIYLGQLPSYGLIQSDLHLALFTGGSEKMRLTSGGSLLLGDSITPYESAWYGTAVFGKNGTNKVITGYLASSTNGAVIGGHNSALSSWADLNINGGSIIFRSDESETARITAAGNVGIGTSNPAWKFVVSKGGAAGLEIDPDTGSSGRIGIYAYNRAVSSYMPISFEANNYSFAVGSVGIGTSNPSEKLTVNGNIYASQGGLIAYRTDGGTGLDVNGGDLGSGSYIARFKNYSNVDKVVIKGNGNVSVSGEISSNYGSNRGTLWLGEIVQQDATFTSYGVLDYTLHNGGGYSHIMRVQGNGNVGIGTTNPLQKLHVYGNIHMDGSQLRFPSGVNVLTLANVSGSWNSLQSQGINIGDWYSNPAYGDILVGDYNFDVIRTDGTHIFRLLNNGNAIIGQGLNRPVTYDSTGGNFRIKGNAGGWATGYFFDGSSGTFRGGFGAFGSNDLVNYYWIGDDYNIPTMIISPNQGRVAIGTTTPQSKFDVTDWTTYISVSSSANSESTYDGQPLAGINFRKHYAIGIGASIKQLQAGGPSSYSQAHLAFYTNDASIGWNDPVERMRITSGGNVGIGTTGPDPFKLAVNGTVGVLGTLNSTLGSYYIDHPGVQSWKIGVTNNNFSTLSIGNDIGGSFANKILNITNAGRVGIGTISPNNRFTVNGGISGTPTWNNSTLELESNGGLTTSLAFHRAGYSISCIYSDDGSLAFSVGGGEKIRITPYNTGVGTSSPNPSAVLDVTSTTQGFLPPRMNDAEMNSISSPAAGLMVWNNDIGSLFVFDGGSWRKIAYA